MAAKNVAIFGATSHIAKGLIFSFLHDKEMKLTLFARNTEKVVQFFTLINSNPKLVSIRDFSNFGNEIFDVIINCVGYGDPGKLQNSYYDFIQVTESFDNLILNYLMRNSNCQYVNMSSGAIYGDAFNQPVEETTKAFFNCNQIPMSSIYGIAKLYSEAKHRALVNFNIVDLRIFGYFSRFIDLKAPYLVTDVLRCVISKETFVTNSIDVWRDFIGYEDLSNLIKSCMGQNHINTAIDVISRQPISKFELLDWFSTRYHLHYEINNEYCNFNSVTGRKQYYFSKCNQSISNFFKPSNSSLMTIEKETEFLLLNK